MWRCSCRVRRAGMEQSWAAQNLAAAGPLTRNRKWTDCRRTCRARGRSLNRISAGLQNCVRTIPLQAQKRGSSGPWPKLQFRRGLSTEGVRVLASGALVVEKLNALNGEILHHGASEVEGELLVEALGIQIWITGDRSPQPKIGKLPRSGRDPFMRNRIVCNEGLIQADRLTVEVIGQGFIRGCGVAQRAGCEIDAGVEILVQLAFHSEAHAQTGAVTVLNALLSEVFAADADIAVEPEAAQDVLQGAQLLVLVLGLGTDQRKLSLGFDGISRSLVGQPLRIGCRLLRLRGGGLRLLGGALYFLRRSVGLLGGIDQLLKLRLQLLHLLALLLHLLLLRGQRVTQLLRLACADSGVGLDGSDPG